MTARRTTEAVVLSLLDGRSDQREIVLQGGRPLPPFTVGSQGEWRVDAGKVAAAHVMLAFNGVQLYVRAVPGENALLDGAPLDARWVVASMPSELRFGSARLVISERPAADEARDVNFSPAAHSVRSPRAEEVTSTDEERLQSALRLSIASPEATASHEYAVPALKPKPRCVTAPLPPLRRPKIQAARHEGER